MFRFADTDLPASDVPNQASNIRTTLSEMFSFMPIHHGTFFDNGKRYCEICGVTTEAGKTTLSRQYAHLGCENCGGVWPENVPEVIWRMHNDEDFVENMTHTIN
jgi:hypothetical protein